MHETQITKPIRAIVELKHPVDTGIKLGIGFMLAPLVVGVFIFLIVTLIQTFVGT